jgi:hypothetical protein
MSLRAGFYSDINVEIAANTRTQRTRVLETKRNERKKKSKIKAKKRDKIKKNRAKKNKKNDFPAFEIFRFSKHNTRHTTLQPP